jgi:hypothetical protein
VAVLRRGGNRFCTKKKIKKTYFEILRFFGNIFLKRFFFLIFFVAEGICRTALPCPSASERQIPASRPARLPACPLACLPACLPACLHACLPAYLPACLPAVQKQ